MTDATECPIDLPEAAAEATGVNPVIERYEVGLLMLAGFAGFSVLVGIAYKLLRRYVFRDANSLDLVFDAGGNVSFSLTAVTVTSQLLWPADFLQSSTMASKVGVGGTLWYTLTIVISMVIFPLLCIQLKTRAPGVKTFPQVAYARFGKPAHVMFCCVALFTNVVIVANLIFAGRTTIAVFTKDVSDEFIVMVLAILFGSYCMVGGLGTTFYISYFNTSIIFIVTSIFILKTRFMPEPEIQNFTSTHAQYDAMACIAGPEGNAGNSMLTFRTTSGLIYAIVTLFMTIAIVFCDQANWQSRIAAKPKQGMMGFVVAALLWFAIPTSVSFVSSLTYKTMSFNNGSNLLTPQQIDEGYITPFVIQRLLGREGCFLFLTLMTMTLMSTGSGEVMSISSVLIYDIFKTYIKPFRKRIHPTDCLLCGKSNIVSKIGLEMAAVCECPSASDCLKCAEDINDSLAGKHEFGSVYKCNVHGKYRSYEDLLLRYKSWCMVWIVVAMVPFGLLLIESGMNLNWTFLAAQVFIAPFLVPLYFTIGWARATSKGLISGSLTGLVAAVIGMFSYASTYDGGLANFFVNTAQDYSILAGLLSGVLVSTVISVVVSLCTKTSKFKRPGDSVDTVGNDVSLQNVTHPDKTGFENRNLDVIPENPDDYEWQKTMSMDNPLKSFKELYKEELEEIHGYNIVTSQHMAQIFGRVRLVSFVGIAVAGGLFVVVVPTVALVQGVLSQAQLSTWVSVCQYWCFVACFFVVVLPPIQEGLQIWRQCKLNKGKESI